MPLEKENPSQLRLANNMTIVTETEQFKRDMIIRFAQTLLPINVFRAKNTRLFLESVMKVPKLSNYKTIQDYMAKLESDCIAKLKQVDFFWHATRSLDKCER